MVGFRSARTRRTPHPKATLVIQYTCEMCTHATEARGTAVVVQRKYRYGGGEAGDLVDLTAD